MDMDESPNEAATAAIPHPMAPRMTRRVLLLRWPQNR